MTVGKNDKIKVPLCYKESLNYSNVMEYGGKKISKLKLTRGIFLKGMSFSDTAANWLPLIIIALLTLSLAGRTFKKKLG